MVMLKFLCRLGMLAGLLGAPVLHGAEALSPGADDIPPPAWSPVPFLRPADFAAYMQQRHAWPKDRLEALFSDYQPNAQVIRLMEPAPPTFKRSWRAYQRRFIEPKRVAAGVAFWRDNQAALERASKRFGVPAHVIVGIIGVETIYGRDTGHFRVLEALATLSFDYPRRAAYFAKELEHFLLWTEEQGLNPKTVKGSFAGAIGLPQFMPGSIRRHALDFDGDGSIDLAGSSADAIGSVGSFLKRHGWQSQSRQRMRIELARPKFDEEGRDGLKRILEAGWQPSLLQPEIEQAGLSFPKPGSAQPRESRKQRWAVFELPNADAPSTWIATDHNFWVITRYNQSPFYAMAVIELGEAVREARKRQRVKPAAVKRGD